MKRMQTLLIAVSLTTLGCPEVSKSGGPSPTPGASPGVSATPADLDPLEGSLFSKDELFALYRAQMAPETDKEAQALLVKQRLITDAGKPHKARQEAFRRALQTYAERDPEGWSEFVQSLSAR